MDELEISIPEGEILVGKRVHGLAWNTLVTSYAHPDDWCFKQFPTMEMLEEYAVEYKLVIKKEGE